MTKVDFIKYLDKRLSVLNEKERNDIKDEYIQHIDMKIASGITEEDAIKDFGDLQSFVDDILIAYNVDPHYKKASITSEKVNEVISSGTNMLTRLLAKIKKVFNKYLNGGNGMDERDKANEYADNIAHEDEVNTNATNKGVKDSNNYSAFSLIRDLVILGIRVFVFFMLMPYVMMLVGAFTALGFLVVALILGYSVLGLVIALLGANMCASVLLILVVKLVYITNWKEKLS